MPIVSRIAGLLLSSRIIPFARSFTPLASVACPSISYSSNDQSHSLARTLSTAATMTTTRDEEDPYIWLEEIDSKDSLDFAKAANDACLSALGNPESSVSYAKILATLESNDRIPHATQHGHDKDGNAIVFNFWKDNKNPKGLWRKTTMESYKTSSPTWTTVLDIDELSAKDGVSWVYKGSRLLPRARDDENVEGGGRIVTRALLMLSDGGADATHVKEFDLTTQSFVESDDAFQLPEAKSRVSYKSRNVVLVGTDFGPESLTDSGYPRTVREWTRGTKLEDAPVIFEGDKKDVSVSVYISDERSHGGGIYEVKVRTMTFYTSKHWVRKISAEELLASTDPRRLESHVKEKEFVEVDLQEDAQIDFLGRLLVISLRSDWEPISGSVYKSGSLITCNVDDFLTKGKAGVDYTVLFKPTATTAYEYFTATKNYFILSTMDTVKNKLDFFRIGDDGMTLTKVGGDATPQIRDCSASPVDVHNGSDEFWFSTSDFTTPSTLFVANAKRVEVANEGDAFIVEKCKSLPAQYNADNLVVRQEFATSDDGTKIPYFIIMSKDTKLDGKNPTLLYGYGGFEVSLGPHYIATAGLGWLERGGVYVEANIRGGGEFGPSWHQAALKGNRHKCYEDFASVAEHLISTEVCSNKSLCIRGGSNGGLLVANMYAMRPDLFAAIHCAVPLIDMKRYHKLLAGASWMAEYGDPDTDDWDFLQKYSPYHNLHLSKEYPPILVTTSTRDDRVHPAHARKFVKKLWDLGVEHVYYYENIEGGHGGAADAKQTAFMTALAYDFMFKVLTENLSRM
ncbi:hypothetical protein MPSEU_000099700 [Mayamaea pseudoterrestris]|nr:hypothetical protein MPSEU_000099700 [Mayamaea pseudoterrestris]